MPSLSPYVTPLSPYVLSLSPYVTPLSTYMPSLSPFVTPLPGIICYNSGLNFEISDTGLLVSKEPDEIKLRYLGPSEPNQTFWERQIVADEKRMKMLKQDLRVLNKWLDEMSEPSYKILRFAPSTLFEQKKLREKHYKERTRRRLEKMSEARRRFINAYHKNYEKSLSSILCPSSQKYLNKTLLTTNNESPGKNTASSYYTAASDFSQIESDIQTEGSDFENNHGNKDYFHQDASHIKKDNEDSFYQSPSSQKNLNNDDSPEQAND
nr:uncharacterized protein LOC122269948 [Parasteatoda tepidariorum]